MSYTGRVESDATITAYPREWLAGLAALPERLTIDAAGYSVAVPIDRDELSRVYLPALNLLISESQSSNRVVAALGGIPGSGKSTFASVLARLADTLLGMGRFVAVGIDGWHWPNAVLDARTTTDEAGRTIPLRQRKGGPESFNVAAIAAALDDLHACRSVVSLPMYDRRSHDPIAGGITIRPGTSIVLLEGNFVLNAEPPWNMVSEQVRPKLFIACDAAAARERVIARHIRGGLAAGQAERKYEANDRLNTAAVLATAGNADYVVRLGENAAIVKTDRQIHSA